MRHLVRPRAKAPPAARDPRDLIDWADERDRPDPARRNHLERHPPAHLVHRPGAHRRRRAAGPRARRGARRPAVRPGALQPPAAGPAHRATRRPDRGRHRRRPRRVELRLLRGSDHRGHPRRGRSELEHLDRRLPRRRVARAGGRAGRPTARPDHSPAGAGQTSAWSATGTACGWSAPAGSACRPPAVAGFGWTPPRSASSATSTAGRSSCRWNGG